MTDLTSTIKNLITTYGYSDFMTAFYTVESTDKTIEQFERCRNCVCLVENENGKWFCDALEKNIEEISLNICS